MRTKTNICSVRGNTFAGDAMQMDVRKTFYRFYTTKNLPLCCSNSHKNYASLPHHCFFTHASFHTV